jgi:hypothetical protein
MKKYSLTHLTDRDLRSGLVAAIAQDRASTVRVLAHVAEFDERKLYLPAAYPSMIDYCERELHLSRSAAYKRITVARCGRDFPDLFANKTRAELELILAQRFPQPDVPTSIRAIGNKTPVASNPQLAPGRVNPANSSGSLLVEGPAPPSPPPRVAPLAPKRFELRVTIDEETHELLRVAQELSGHQIPSRDVARILRLALKEYVATCQKRKFAATNKPRTTRRRTASKRHIPSAVQREVWKRDQGQCTFVSDDGRRCPARHRLEYDHIEPVARGGEATVSNIRLRCRAHNQYAAECAFGSGFMNDRRRGAGDDHAPAIGP